MTTSVVLGLDIASRTGWCRFDGVSFETGVLDCTPKINSEPEGGRFQKFAQQLPELLEGVGAAMLERTYSRGKRTARRSLRERAMKW